MGMALPGAGGATRQSMVSGAQVIDGSLKFVSGSSNYLNRTPSSTGNRKTWTWSGWVKFANITKNDQVLFSAVSGSAYVHFRFMGVDPTASRSYKLNFQMYDGSTSYDMYTDRVIRDPGSWYHLVLFVDYTQSTAADRTKIYVNNELTNQVDIAGTGSASIAAQNYDTYANLSGAVNNIGYHSTYGEYFDGSISQVYLIDGQALGPDSFGYTDPLTNTWRPKKYEGTFGIVPGDYVISGGSNYLNREPADMFDGSTSTYWQAAASGDRYQLMTFTTPKTGTTIELSVLASNGWDGFEINGSVPSSLPGVGSQSWFNITTHTSGSLSSIKVAYTAGMQTQLVYALRIDGTIITGQTETPSASNSFYLPFDGNSPIGDDKSGQGNNWTPTNFGGSLELGNPNVSGARPILNTGTGGTVARPGVFGSEVGFRDTVSGSSGGGNPYIFNTNGTRPTFNFIRGATYVFDYSGATSHPLRFATAADAAGSTQYTDGTSVSGNVISFTVPHNAPNTLHYYCTNHSGMGNSISVTTDETKADPYAWKNVLALPLVGSANDVSNSVGGSDPKTVTNYNSNAVFSSTNSNFYNGSVQTSNANNGSADGSAKIIQVASSSDFAFSGDFTVETWIYATAIESYAAICGNYVSVNNFFIEYSTERNLLVGFNNTNYSGSSTAVANVWKHIAVTRSGSTLRTFVDGIETSSHTASGSIAAQDFGVGGYHNRARGFEGHIQDFRIYNGVAKYTSNFVVASTSPDILPDTPSGVSGGSKLTKITDGAVNFDGTGDYLSVPSSSDFTFGTGDFTLEYFINTTDTNFNVMHPDSATGTGYWGHIVQSSSFNWNDAYNSSNKWNVNAVPILTGGWHHCAICRASGTTKVFFDGISQSATGGSFSDSTDYSGVDGWEIGGSGNLSDFNGFISNFRVLKGTALYTTNFTPPSEPLTNVTNTKLLCCQSNTSANSATVTPGTFSNSGVVYSSGIAGSQDTSSGGGSVAAFDGKLGSSDSDGSYPAAGQTLTWTPANSALGTTLPYSSSIRVYVKVDANGDDGGLIVIGANGSQTVDAGSVGTRYVDISAASSPITSIAWSRASSGGQGVGLQAVEVDGTTLIDGLAGKTVTRAGDAAATNFNPFNTDINTVRGQETGYNTLNPLAKANITLSNGNLDLTHSGSNGNWQLVLSTIGMSSGKFYCEFLCQDADSVIGIAKGTHVIANDKYVGNDPNGWGYNGQNGQKLNNSSGSSYGSSYTAGDLIGIAFDADNGTLSFYKNNIDQGQAFSGLTDEYYFAFSIRDTGYTHSVNFGQKPFKFPPPAGFQPLNVANVRPETVIARPDQYVKTVLWTGNDVARSIVTGNAPDFVWIKDRSITKDPVICDSVRGAGETLRPDDPGPNVTAIQRVSSFNSNGFSVGTDSGVNNNNDNFVGWTWKAGGNKNTFNKDDVGYASAAAAGLTGGSTAPNGASVGTKQGFSIIKWTGTGSGTSLGHGLGSAPDFVIVKSLANTREWLVWHSSFNTASNTDYLYLNTNGSKGGSGAGDYWNNTAPTSTTFSVGNSAAVNSGGDFIAYLWHDVPGLQKFGTYEGSGNINTGPFVELGFKPALLIVKNMDDQENWYIYDTKRSPSNVAYQTLQANSGGAENTGNTNSRLDLLSNGFKLRQGNGPNNANTYIYCAWAEAPTFNLYGAQSNAF